MLKSKKKILSAILSLVMLLALSCGAWAALTPNADDVYEIGTAAELAEFRDMVNAGSNDIDAILTANITLPNEPWMPIGTLATPSGELLDNPYIGTFDGNGKKITGMKIRSSTLAYATDAQFAVAGLFAYLSSANYSESGTIQNLLLVDIDIDLSDYTEMVRIGGISSSLNGGRIRNCGIIGGSIKGSGLSDCGIGGIVGYAGGSLGDGEISGCFVKDMTEIGNGGNVGGLAGTFNSGATISNSYVSNIGKISGVGLVGGLVGYFRSEIDGYTTTLRNCYAEKISQVISTGTASSHASTLVAYVAGKEPVSIQNCVYLNGPTTINGDTFEGGILGELRFDPEINIAKVQNCLYPAGLTFTNYDNRPIGNMTDAEITAAGRDDLLPYDPEDGPIILPAFTASFKQGPTLNLQLGQAKEIDILLYPGEKGLKLCSWKSEAADVASVSGSGLKATLTANALGTAEIVATVVTDGLATELTCMVNVVEQLVDAEVSGTPGLDSIYPGDTVDLTYEFDLASGDKVNDVKQLVPAGSGLIVGTDEDGNVTLTGTATKPGNYTYEVELTVDGETITQTMPVTVRCDSETTGTPGLDEIYPGTEVDLTTVFADGAKAKTVDTSGMEGSGLTVYVNSKGEVVVEGTATNPGNYSYEVTIELEDGTTMTQTMPVVVRIDPEVTGGDPENIQPGDEVEIIYDFGDGNTVTDIDDSGLDGSGLEAVLDDDGNVVLSGDATEPGNYEFEVTVEDENGNSVTQTMPVNIAAEFTTSGTPEDGVIETGMDVDLTYDFGNYTPIPEIDNSGMQTELSGLLAEIVGGKVVLTGVAKEPGSYYYVVTLQRQDGTTFTQKVPVEIFGESTPTAYGGGGSSNCNAGMGFWALVGLLGLAWTQKRK